MKVTVHTRPNYNTHKKVPFTFNLNERAVIRNALRLYYSENYSVYDRSKDVGDDAINLARCKVVKHLLKNVFPREKKKPS